MRLFHVVGVLSDKGFNVVQGELFNVHYNCIQYSSRPVSVIRENPGSSFFTLVTLQPGVVAGCLITLV